MTQEPDAPDAQEAEAVGEKPDLGHRSDALIHALDGSDMGSDTTAGSLRGGSASGSDNDPDQAAINEALASEGMNTPEPKSFEDGEEVVRNTGDGADHAADEKDADAATG